MNRCGVVRVPAEDFMGGIRSDDETFGEGIVGDTSHVVCIGDGPIVGGSLDS